MFARLAVVAPGWSRQDESLTQALMSREKIGQAGGIVMERHDLNPGPSIPVPGPHVPNEQRQSP